MPAAVVHQLRPDESRAVAVLERHGGSLQVLASLLTDDAETADAIVVQAIIAHAGAPASLRELSSSVHLAWCCRDPAVDTMTPPSRLAGPPSVLEEMCALPHEERVALGLCRFGGHTSGQAAELLSVSAAEVARWLTSALRTLSRPVDSVHRSPTRTA